jgi:2-polyprenyl-6-methoxyphenol hydroxylase-like FAD-dependent oxidoreductase
MSTDEARAIVVGGGMAGMLAGRVLSDHFERVTIVDRDRYPDRPAPRRGLPQSRHVHVLLLRGMQILEDLFPGFEAEMVDAGAHIMDSSDDIRFLTPQGWRIRYRSGLMYLSFSRPLIDWWIRRRLMEDPQIRFLETCEVTGLTTAAGRERVNGVEYRFRDAAPDHLPAEGALRAEFVVDASGRFSRTPQWLESLGYTPPHETVIDPHIGYASRWYKMPAGFNADWRGFVLAPEPPSRTRGGVLLPVEGLRWLVTLAGMVRDYPPTDEAGFLHFARTLQSSEIYGAIKGAEPASPIAGHRAMGNRLRHYERMARWPEGFVVLGDGVCNFNPIYGQGMTVAAIAVMTLDACLCGGRRSNGDLTGVARRFQKRLAKANKAPWLMATSHDLRWPETEGGRPGLITRPVNRYLDYVFAAAVRDPVVDREFVEVTHMLKEPAALFHPRVVIRVAKQALGRALEDRN